MGNYSEIKFGMHRGTPINEIPMDYLIWLFPGLQHNKKYHSFYKEVLKYFLSRDIRIEDYTSKSQGYHFYFNDYHNPKPVNGERPFMQSFRRMKNSNGEFVYEVGSNAQPVFLDVTETGFEISKKYVAHSYRFGGLKMVFEKNPDYYFYDGYGKVMVGAYLMRKPWIPEGSLAGDFSKNLSIKKLEGRTDYQTF